MRERRGGRLVSAVLCLCLTGPLPLDAQKAAPPAPPGRPKLVVVISVDGLSWPNLMKYRSWYTSGLKRLLDEGFAHTQAHYQHINTETSPGHASLATGAPPSVTGIVANRWLARSQDGAIRSVYSTQMFVPPAVPGDPPLFYREVARDERLYVFAFAREYDRWQSSGETGRAIMRVGDGPRGETVVFDSEDAIALFNQKYGKPAEPLPARATMTGPGNLKVDALGDRLVMASPASRVVSVSAKDRTAVLLAGRSPRHLVYWFDRETGRFVTSPYYDTYSGPGTAGQAAVARFNREKAGATLPSRFGTQWRPLPMPPAATGSGSPALPQPDLLLADFQVPVNGLGFPHDLTFGQRGYFTGFYYSPFIDDLVTELAVTLIGDEDLGLGTRTTPDILFVGLSAQDTVSHSYGPESAENLDLLRRLDVHIGTLLDTLAGRGLSREDVIVAVSADHGFSDIPEASRARDQSFGGGRLVDGGHVMPGFYPRLNRLLSESLCLPESSRPIFGGEGWSMTYNHPLLPMRTVEGPCGPADRQITVGDIDRVLADVAMRHFREEIESVLLVSRRASWPQNDPAVRFVLNDFDPERSGDAFIIPRYGVLMHDDPIRGTGHGTHHDYDTHVPLLFWGGSWPAGSSDAAVTPYDLAPTLGVALGVTVPDATGKPLTAGSAPRRQ